MPVPDYVWTSFVSSVAKPLSSVKATAMFVSPPPKLSQLSTMPEQMHSAASTSRVRYNLHHRPASYHALPLNTGSPTLSVWSIAKCGHRSWPTTLSLPPLAAKTPFTPRVHRWSPGLSLDLAAVLQRHHRDFALRSGAIEWRLNAPTPNPVVAGAAVTSSSPSRAALDHMRFHEQQLSTVQWRLLSSLSISLTAWELALMEGGQEGRVGWTHFDCCFLALLRCLADHSIGWLPVTQRSCALA